MQSTAGSTARNTARRGIVGLVAVLLAALAAVTFVMYEPSAGAAPAPKGEFRLDLVIPMPPPGADGTRTTVGEVVAAIASSGLDGDLFTVDSVVDVTLVSDRASSGQDFIRPRTWKVSSFIDVSYEFGVKFTDAEMVALSLVGSLSDPSNPGVVLDAVGRALKGSGPHYGHVTVLK